MRQRATRMSGNAHGPLKPLAALIAAMFAATSAPAFDWSASDLSTQYQDAGGTGGTLPVTSVEQPVGIVLDRSKGGAPRGPTIVQNGGFSIDAIWIKGLGWSIANGVATRQPAAGGSVLRQVVPSLVAGRTYEVIFEHANLTVGVAVTLRDNALTGLLALPGTAVATGTYRQVFVCPANATSIEITSGTANTSGTFDNFSLRELNGTNVWSGAPNVYNGWVDNSDGSYTMAGVNGLMGWSTPKLIPGRTYEVVMRVSARTSGSVAMPYDGTGANILYQTTAGTFRRILVAPANAALYVYSNAFVGTIDSISVVEIPGNHLIQPTSTSRPTLSARVNMLTYSEQISNAAWAKTTGGTASTPTVTDNFGIAPDGTTTASRVQLALNGGTSTSDFAILRQVITGNPIGGSYTHDVWLKTNDGTTKVILQRDDQASTVTRLLTVTGQWQQFTISGTSGGTTTIGAIGLWLRGAQGTADSADLLMWHPQFTYGPPARYQRIGAATDYDTLGFAKGWRFDGTDDSLYSPAAIAWGTNKVSITAAIRKQSDAATAMVLEFGPISTSDGTFYLAAPLNAGVANVGTGSRGTSAAFVAVTGVPAPAGLILSMTGDIAAPSIALRVNGVPSNASSTTQGAGSYGNYVMNMGRRNNSSNPFNGVIHSLRGNGRVQSPDELGWLEAQAKIDMNNNL